MVSGLNLNRILLATALLCMGLSSYSQAQEMRDPTRPAGTTDVIDGDTAPPTGGLQSILRRSGAKPQALINGELVSLGGKVGEARLIKINESSVVLLSASGRETLTLTPGIEKTRPTRSSHRTAP